MTRREILTKAQFLLIPVLGLVALVVFPIGFLVGLVYPPWGEGIWDVANRFADRIEPFK